MEWGAQWHSYVLRQYHNKKALRHNRKAFSTGSPGGTRTPDQLVTSTLTFLPGLDYLIARVSDRGHGRRALWRFIGWGPQPLVSARSCLLLPLRQASLRITIEENGISSLGFPEFTRFFIPPHGGKLQFLQPTALPTELPGK